LFVKYVVFWVYFMNELLYMYMYGPVYGPELYQYKISIILQCQETITSKF